MSQSAGGPALMGVGDLAADVVVRFPDLPVQKDDFFLADQFLIEAGGTASFLIMASRLGAPSIAIGSLGDDVWGHEIQTILESEQVDLSLITPSGTTTRALVLVDQQGGHAFIGRFGQSEGLELGVSEQVRIRKAGAVFSSGYSLSEEHLAPLTLQAMRIAGEAGVLRAFDPGPAYSHLPRDRQFEVLTQTDILLLTEEELALVSPAGIIPLLDRGINMVVLKRGARGCEVHTPAGCAVSQPGFPVPVVDTTAAGDSFAAGFLRALTMGHSLEVCAQFANAVGAVKVQKLGGGRSVPSADEIAALLSRFHVDLPMDLL